MRDIIKSLATISRPEFLPANLASVVIGSAWGFHQSTFDWMSPLLLFLAFSIITVVSAIGAQLNSLFDYDLDSKDTRKKQIVESINNVGNSAVTKALIVELLISSALVSLFLWVRQNPAFLLMWITAIALAYAYSAPPLRLKSKSWLSAVALVAVLCFLPILFVYYTLTYNLNAYFLLFLAGQAMTVYGVIIPTEIRDYFVDKAMNVETLTVKLGLVKASLLAAVLLILGGVFSSAAFILELTVRNVPQLSVFLLVMVVADYLVLRKYKVLYVLSKKYATSETQGTFAQDIVDLAAQNPKWITLVSQAVVLMSIVLLTSKLLF